MKTISMHRRGRVLASVFCVAAFAAGCAALRYDEPGIVPAAQASNPAAAASDAAASESAVAATDAAATTATTSAPSMTGPTSEAMSGPMSGAATTRPSSPTRARLAQRDRDDAGPETGRDWRELSRRAREHAQNGEFDEAETLLEQAALQLKDRRPTSTRRRTVFGLRARLAHDLAALGEIERADLLADRLFEEVRAEPALGDTALVTLARATANRRREAAREAGRTESQLPLLALAFDASLASPASRERLGLAFEVSNKALRDGELELARRAIDQTIEDARITAPADRMQAAALEIYKARIALAARDLDVAAESAETAVRIFEREQADPSSRGVAEATLGQILAEQGELDRAFELGRGAYARLAGPGEIVAHARRQIPAALARIEWLAGEREAASAHYREALAVPADGSERDDNLIADIKAALVELETGAAVSAAAP